MQNDVNDPLRTISASTREVSSTPGAQAELQIAGDEERRHPHKQAEQKRRDLEHLHGMADVARASDQYVARWQQYAKGLKRLG